MISEMPLQHLKKIAISFMQRTGETYIWTNHAHQKMRHYHLTESRIKRIIRHPTRVEEGIIENGIACMQPAGGKNYSEIWAMYVLAGYFENHQEKEQQKIKIITCWRYPGKSASRDPIPLEVLREIQMLL